MYKTSHSIASKIMCLLFIVPLGALAYAICLLACPIVVGMLLVVDQTYDDFKSDMHDIYVQVPCDYWRWCVLGH